MSFFPSAWNPPPDEGDAWEGLWNSFLTHFVGLVFAAISFNTGGVNDNINHLKHDFMDLWEGMENFAVKTGRTVKDWADDYLDDLRDDALLAWWWILDTFNNIGSKITDSLYTAVTWAEAKRDEAWDWVTVGYANVVIWAWGAWVWVRDKAGDVWDWISDYSGIVWAWILDKSGIVWDWIERKAGFVWEWVYGVGTWLTLWWSKRKEALDTWVDTYLDYYQDLFDLHGNALLDFLDDPLGYVSDLVIENLLYIVEQAVIRYW